MKTRIVATIIAVMIGTSGCAQNAAVFEYQDQQDTSNVDAAVKERKSSLLEKEDPNAINASIIVQCEEEWKPYYNRIKERIESSYPDSSVEIVVEESMNYIAKVIDTSNGELAKADVYSVPLASMESLYGVGALAKMNASFVSSNIGSTVTGGLKESMIFNGDYYGYTMGIECDVAYINLDSAEYNDFDFSESVEITLMDENTALLPLYEKEISNRLLIGIGESLYQPIEQVEGEKRKEIEYDELNSESQRFISAIHNYWTMYSGTSLWSKGEVKGYTEDQFNGSNGSIIKIGSSASDKSGLKSTDTIEAIPLERVKFDGNDFVNWQDGWAYVLNSKIEDDESKRLLAEMFVSELLNPANAAQFYLFTGKIMENATIDDFIAIQSFDASVISAVLTSFPNAKAYGSDKIDEQRLLDWEEALLTWEIEQPRNFDKAYELLEEIYMNPEAEGNE